MIRGHRIKNCAAAEDRILLIPEGLHDFAGAEVIMTSGRAGIFHKLLYQDAFGTEFLSNAPCLAYVLRGRETFVDADGEETTVVTGDTLLVPRHHHMVSEFSSETGPLEAVLFFFSDAVIAEFLAATSHGVTTAPRSRTALFAGSPSLHEYVSALPRVYGGLQASPALVKSKLLELLLLLDLHDHQGQLWRFLVHENSQRARRNIKQVMRAHALADLSVADYATLSGRSVSTFQRDFKRAFGEAPSVWLRRARLDHARVRVIDGKDTIADIALAAGYSDTSHFIKAYKAHFDQTPKQHRLQLA
ncbi:AraC family transcriptional regulator [Phaeobacter piscinae]|uniref:AraC family transcriptional regulator n=1 Tax=Phaeobacter piscinae TaxID=1580596 RepID=UPI0006946DA1|nr:AraC family transcriptional regulator [Phaeobacter piscinae]UTS81871.1 Exoenzyme S synthesis regulatory protein ExsA [Phaeobacter piscinae]